jgi:hypothetical protein
MRSSRHAFVSLENIPLASRKNAKYEVRSQQTRSAPLPRFLALMRLKAFSQTLPLTVVESPSVIERRIRFFLGLNLVP